VIVVFFKKARKIRYIIDLIRCNKLD
jgi:hypothetical protein